MNKPLSVLAHRDLRAQLLILLHQPQRHSETFRDIQRHSETFRDYIDDSLIQLTYSETKSWTER